MPKKKEVELIKRDRPECLTGETWRARTGCGKIYVTVNIDGNGRLFEVFANMGKAGGCASSQTEALGRLVSLILRCGGSLERIVKQLDGISCHTSNGKSSSCANAVASVLKKYDHGEEKK